MFSNYKVTFKMQENFPLLAWGSGVIIAEEAESEGRRVRFDRSDDPGGELLGHL